MRGKNTSHSPVQIQNVDREAPVGIDLREVCMPEMTIYKTGSACPLVVERKNLQNHSARINKPQVGKSCPSLSSNESGFLKSSALFSNGTLRRINDLKAMTRKILLYFRPVQHMSLG